MKKLKKIIGGSMAAVAALALTTQAQNLLVNGDFEDAGGFTANPIAAPGINGGWALFGAVAQSDMMASPVDSPQSGVYALLEQNAAGNNWNPAGAYQIVGGVIPGITLTFSIWAITDTGTTWGPTPVDISLGFLDATLTTIGYANPPSGSFSFGTSVANNANNWVEYSVTGTAPAGAQYAIVYAMFMDNGQPTTENVYFDNAGIWLVPEPSTLAFLGMGLAVPFCFIHRRKS